MASLRDANLLHYPHPVVSLVPRSTTGYLRDWRNVRTVAERSDATGFISLYAAAGPIKRNTSTLPQVSPTTAYRLAQPQVCTGASAVN